MDAKLVLRTAIGQYEGVRALRDGTVVSPRLRLDLVEVEPVIAAFRRMIRSLEFDICEMALTTQAQAYAYGKPITALPIVLQGRFHHAALVCRRDAPLRGPADLAGKRVGVRAWSQTTGVWVRGILQDEYGVDPASVTWLTAEGAHVEEYQDPPWVVRIAPGQELGAMLLSGEIDAGIGLSVADPTQLRTVIPDDAAAAADWFRRIGVHPVNHVLVAKEAVLAEHPWLAGELMELFSAARRAAFPAEDKQPQGLAANRAGIEMLCRYAAQQGLIARAYRADELFMTGLD